MYKRKAKKSLVKKKIEVNDQSMYLERLQTFALERNISTIASKKVMRTRIIEYLNKIESSDDIKSSYVDMISFAEEKGISSVASIVELRQRIEKFLTFFSFRSE